MRSSPVAPVPAVTDSKKSSASTTVSSSTSESPVTGTRISRKIVGDDVSPRRLKMKEPQFQTAATKQFGNLPFQLSDSPYAFGTLDSELPTLTSSSTSMEEDNVGDSNSATPDGEKYDVNEKYDAPFVDRRHIDDISHASTDDPYTYSDDSASLSDAYFLQQPSPDSSRSNAGYFSLLPLTSSDREQVDPGSKDATVWPGPPLIHLDDKLSPMSGIWRRHGPNSRITSIHSSGRHTERYQRRHQRQRQQERNISSLSSTIDKEEPINENTSLLDDTSTVEIRHRDREYTEEQKQKFARATITDGSIAKSNAHQQHRKKHQLRKYKRNLQIQEQQKRQEERERAVLEVRGQPQPLTTQRHRFWLILFLLQLFLVCSCAIKYGLTFYRPSTPADQDFSSFPSSSTTVSPSDKIDSIAASSMLLTGVETDVPIGQSENIDHPLSTLGFSDDGDHDTDESELAASTQDKPFTIDYKNVLSLLLISGMYACITSYLSFAFMLILARSIIPIMLVFTILILLCWGVFGSTFNTNAGSIISLGGFIVFGMSFAYTMSNWNQIPFCSTNFHTAICAIRSSIGILLVGVSSLFVGLVWLLIWATALMGTFNRNNSADCEMWDECETHLYIFRFRIIEFGLLLVSLNWTIMVIKNIVRVAVAGAIGGPWWFATVHDNADCKIQLRGQSTFDRCCSCWCKSIVSDPLVRACTTSLGTICFGSLVDFPAHLLSKIVSCLCWLSGSSGDDLNSHPSSEVTQQITNDNSEDEENSDNRSSREGTNTTGGNITKEIMLLPSQQQAPTTVATYFGVLKKRLRRLDRVLQSCNRWSYIYIGMYNYSFCEGGEKAIQLFETREWMDIARDTLIQNILLMASIVIGGLSGMVAVLVEEVDGYEFTSLHKPILTSFLIGFFLGFILSNILLLGLAASAVNTVLVCFAAEPFAFDRNHPHLSREMREVWSQQVWEPDGSGG
jgi:hypothetical protein